MTDLRRWVTWELLANLAIYEMMGQTGLLAQKMKEGGSKVTVALLGGNRRKGQSFAYGSKID